MTKGPSSPRPSFAAFAACACRGSPRMAAWPGEGISCLATWHPCPQHRGRRFSAWQAVALCRRACVRVCVSVPRRVSACMCMCVCVSVRACDDGAGGRACLCVCVCMCVCPHRPLSYVLLLLSRSCCCCRRTPAGQPAQHRPLCNTSAVPRGAETFSVDALTATCNPRCTPACPSCCAANPRAQRPEPVMLSLCCALATQPQARVMIPPPEPSPCTTRPARHTLAPPQPSAPSATAHPKQTSSEVLTIMGLTTCATSPAAHVAVRCETSCPRKRSGPPRLAAFGISPSACPPTPRGEARRRMGVDGAFQETAQIAPRPSSTGRVLRRLLPPNY